jgi:hypothetical protein
MQNLQHAASFASNFDLKNTQAVLIAPHGASQQVVMSVQQLEAIRTTRRAVPASKHGLEVICGGSCETGAQ